MSITLVPAMEAIAQAAVAIEYQTKVPAEILAAQCIVETGWLRYLKGNNAFGVKYNKLHHYDSVAINRFGRQLLRTTEYFTENELILWLREKGYEGRALVKIVDDGKYRRRNLYEVFDVFLAFHSLEDSFNYQAEMFKDSDYYQRQFKIYLKSSAPSPYRLNSYVLGIARVYATNPDYGNRLIEIMKDPFVVDYLNKARQRKSQHVKVEMINNTTWKQMNFDFTQKAEDLPEEATCTCKKSTCPLCGLV